MSESNPKTESSLAAADSLPDRRPKVAKGRTLLAAMAVLSALTIAWEAHLRNVGAQRMEIGVELIATAHRLKAVQSANEPQVVFVGSSRTFVGVSPRHVASGAELKHTDVSLFALPGTSARPLAEFLDDNVGFTGVVIAEVNPVVTYLDSPSAFVVRIMERLQMADWFEDAEYRLESARASLRLAAEQNAFVIRLRHELRRIVRVATGEAADELAMSDAYRGHEDGWTELRPNAAFLDFAAKDIVHAAKMLSRYARAYDYREWLRALDQWVALDARLKAKGITLIFVRYPSAGVYWEAEQMQFPNDQYWRTLELQFPGRCWHFRDNPEFHNLNMPDGSHLVSEDALRWSRWLGQRLRPLLERKALPSAGGG